MAEPNGTAWGETLVSFVSFLSTVRYLVHSISRQLPGQSSQAATVSPCMQCAQTNPTANLLFPLRQATAILFLSGITLSHVIVWLALAQTYHVSPGQQHLKAVSDFFLTQLTLLHGQVLHVCNRTATAAALTGMPSCSLSHKGIAEPSSISVDISNPNIILLRYCQ